MNHRTSTWAAVHRLSICLSLQKSVTTGPHRVSEHLLVQTGPEHLLVQISNRNKKKLWHSYVWNCSLATYWKANWVRTKPRWLWKKWTDTIWKPAR